MLPHGRKTFQAAFVIAITCAAAGWDLATGGPTAREAAKHWAFHRIVRPAVPAVKQAKLLRTPVDAFVLAALERKQLTFAPPADRATLLRRLTFDVIGLPPRPEEIEQFVSDQSPDAYPRAVERLLASPHYGERWGKYWLDVAGYADSNGYFNADSDRPFAYRYRDYVIRAVNSDEPFDQFVREQLAGDELSGDAPGKPITRQAVELLTATHFLRNGQDGTSESDGNPDERRTDRATALQSTLQITMNALFGVTIQCARCHDHKFEPVSQADYYRLQSVFYPAFPAYDPDHWVKPNDRLRDIPTEQNVASSPAQAAKPVKPTKAGKRAKAAKDANAPKLAWVTDVMQQPPPTRILNRGNYGDFGPAVVPAGLSVLCDGPPELHVKVPYPGSRSTGRRLAFAQWLTAADSRASALLARVLVNRIWQRHFGTGIVATPDNFGLSGSPPTHPELLEYLAHAFRESGWSLKAVHRLILLSAAYQQSSGARSDALAADPNDRLLSRFPVVRLDAEALHDAMLAVSGELSDRLYGAYVPTDRGDDGSVVVRDGQKGAGRRGLYLQQHRTEVATILELFDAPVMVNNCPVRSTSTVPLQSLALLNSAFVRRRAAAFASTARERRLEGDGLADGVRRTIVAAFGRKPTPMEERASLLLP
ncbi:MAG TPA: DUF1549 and DUF1553 domain-containing protein, partial [Planctomycetaceae bacterium]|nr:DUF1549 and DUF1553 domain-containing protein [Planctomycetaceae bacterium]